ncbi:protein of unknown function [Shewanella benthica]|uniref:Uncharacterized protein n=1 Tax=Shewanella benthica TaxID=43661 RepID=A0A330M0W1_9GAMM|nr:protein of unknown function [Shewanella benthica]
MNVRQENIFVIVMLHGLTYSAVKQYLAVVSVVFFSRRLSWCLVFEHYSYQDHLKFNSYKEMYEVNGYSDQED